MYIQRTNWLSKNGKVYTSILLRESVREGKKVRKKTIANLTHRPPEEVAAIELALRHKHHLQELGSIQETRLKEGRSVGAVWTVFEVARQLGINQALGESHEGKLALWQVIARVIDQGSRLSAVRLARTQAACEVLDIQKGFSENDLYDNLTWLTRHQEQIEHRLFSLRRGEAACQLFLYDVTSSYLEGEQNELGAYGYNRDGKKGKKQIVIGLLCDEEGEAVSVQVFEGNTQDVTTFSAQVKKVARRFGCRKVTLVGDRGMIKSAGVEELQRAGFHYITAITKPQIERLLKAGALQLELFEESVGEIFHQDSRYILRRNAFRAKQLAATREEKRQAVELLVRQENQRLQDHPRAKAETCRKTIEAKIKRLKIDSWLAVKVEGRRVFLETNPDQLAVEARLDGCYVLRTDLSPAEADKEIVHERYKDLALVEQAFRTSKTTHLEVRPVYVRTAENTRGHVFVVMLAYLIIRRLQRAWNALDLTVEEGLDQLKTLCLQKLCWKDVSFNIIPEPRAESQKLLDAAQVKMPPVLPTRKAIVDTYKKLPKKRKSS